MALAVLAHVDADHRVLVVEHVAGQRPRQLRLTDARLAEEDEAADRPLRVLEAGAGATDRVRQGDDRPVLADDALVEAVLHVKELLRLPFEHARHWYAGHHRDQAGDVLRRHLQTRPAPPAATPPSSHRGQPSG